MICLPVIGGFGKRSRSTYLALPAAGAAEE
jgi:hypothetical protein